MDDYERLERIDPELRKLSEAIAAQEKALNKLREKRGTLIFENVEAGVSSIINAHNGELSSIKQGVGTNYGTANSIFHKLSERHLIEDMSKKHVRLRGEQREKAIKHIGLSQFGKKEDIAVYSHTGELRTADGNSVKRLEYVAFDTGVRTPGPPLAVMVKDEVCDESKNLLGKARTLIRRRVFSHGGSSK